jgi:hypothetical protein
MDPDLFLARTRPLQKNTNFRKFGRSTDRINDNINSFGIY